MATKLPIQICSGKALNDACDRNAQLPMKDVFLCHTGTDKPWLEHLAERLEAETID